MLSNIGRAALRRVGGGATQSTNRALQTIWCIRRVDRIQTPENRPQFTVARQRSYATTTKAAPKPKSASAAKAKPKAGTKKAVKKPLKKKPPKKKVVAKKPKKTKTVKPLTEEQKLKAKVKQLKAVALLDKPKGKPHNAWQLVLAEHMKGTTNTGSLGSQTKDAVAKYKSLSPEELQAYNHTANQNKAENEKAYTAWLNSHTPDAIRIANNARVSLKKLGQKGQTTQIRDERLPKRPTNARLQFLRDRHASGDFEGVSIADSARLIGKEWSELSPDAKKPYEEAAVADKLRYAQEFKTVFHRESRSRTT